MRRRDRSTAWKLCSLLLQYPDEKLVEARTELIDAVDRLPRSAAATALARFGGWWTTTDPLEISAHYVEMFDLEKRCGLYLTFYSDGDRRERGMALLRLKRLYRAAGLPLESGELPDYLPVMLEFAASAGGGRGEIVLREHRSAIELVRLALSERGSPYAEALEAVCALLGPLSAAERAGMRRLAAAGPPQELVGLEPFAPPEVMPQAGPRR